MANYVMSKLLEKWNRRRGQQTVDFKRSNYVLKETDRLEMRSRSHVLDTVQKNGQSIGLAL
jgi:hypothetical protein